MKSRERTESNAGARISAGFRLAGDDIFDRTTDPVEDASLAERIEEQRWEAALVDLVASDARDRLAEVVREIARVPKLVHSRRRRDQLEEMAEAVRQAVNRLELATMPRSRLKRRAVG